MKVPHHLKLNDKHPLTKKIEEVFALMDKLNLTFQVNDNSIFVTDSSQNRFSEFFLKDIEGDHYNVDVLPPSTEYKIIVINPEYLEEQEKQRLAALAAAEVEKIEREKAKELRIRREKESELANKKCAARNLAKEISDLEKELT